MARFVARCLFPLLAAWSGIALAQTFPTKPILFIMPFAAGTTVDVMARVVTARMGQELGQPIVVESKVGANGVIGIRQLATSRPDGYTLGLSGNTTHAAAVSLYKNLGYDPLKDFTHIGLITYLPWVLVAGPAVPAADLAELVAHIRAHPGRMSVSYYSGSSRLAMSKLRGAGGLDVLEVPYTSATQILGDIRNGQLQLAFLTPDVATAQAKAGVVKIMGVSTAARLPDLPQVPSIGETLPNFGQIVSWAGIAAPAGVPAEAAARLQDALAKAMADPAIQQKLRQLGGDPVPTGPEEIAGKIRAEMPQWAQFVKDAKIEPQ